MRTNYLKIIAIMVSLCLLIASCAKNADISHKETENVVPQSHTVTIGYILPENIYKSKDEMFFSFFSSFYQYIIDEKGADGLSHLTKYGINNLTDALTACKKWDNGHDSGIPIVGYVYAPYFFENAVGSDFSDHQEEDSFIGFCLRNNKYIDLLHFFRQFFYYWRLDEGFTTNTNNGSDFFASSYASIIDIAKFFYFTKEKLPSYFHDEKNIPELYDKVPGLLYEPVNIIETVTLNNYDNIEYIINPNFRCYGFMIDGYYLDDDFSTKIDKLTFDDIKDMDNIHIYVKFKRNMDEQYK